MRWLAALALTGFITPALAENPAPPDPPLGAEAFERLVEGKTMNTHDGTGIYGVETFLPGRRAIWRDDAQCLEGTWRAEGAMICFDYEGDPQPYCWTYHDQGDFLMGWYEGDRSTDPILLYPAKDVVTCDGFLGA